MAEIYEYKLKPHINKQLFLKKHHLDVGIINGIDKCFDKLLLVLREHMLLLSVYIVKDNMEFIYELPGCEKYIICFISDKNDINKIVNQMMSDGNYFSGYLLNELATEAIFNASDELKELIKKNTEKSGYFI